MNEKMERQSWELEELYFENEHSFSALLSAINAACSSIDFEMYIFETDSLGREIMAQLIVAARRGVAVRIIVDAIGSPAWHRFFAEQAQEAGIEFKIFREFSWRRLFRRRVPGRFVQTLFSTFTRMNKRTHRKMIIIDHREAFVGSMNVAEYYRSAVAPGAPWRDTSVRVRGVGVAELRDAFNRSWISQRAKFREFFRERRKRAPLRSGLVRLNARIQDRRHGRRVLIAELKAAREKILLTTAYFAPQRRLLREILNAPSRGVEVRILLPERSDIFFMSWLAQAYFIWLIKAGVRVYLYQPRILHAKTALIDETVFVGSSNLNHRSFFHDLEVDIVLTSPESRSELEMQFFEDLRFSREVELDECLRAAWWKRFLGSVAMEFRYWL